MLCLPFYLIIFLNTQCVLKCLVHIRMCSYLIICVIFASVSLHLSVHKCLNAIFVLPFSMYLDFLFTHIVCTYNLVYTMMCTFYQIDSCSRYTYYIHMYIHAYLSYAVFLKPLYTICVSCTMLLLIFASSSVYCVLRPIIRRPLGFSPATSFA